MKLVWTAISAIVLATVVFVGYAAWSYSTVAGAVFTGVVALAVFIWSQIQEPSSPHDDWAPKPLLQTSYPKKRAAAIGLGDRIMVQISDSMARPMEVIDIHHEEDHGIRFHVIVPGGRRQHDFTTVTCKPGDLLDVSEQQRSAVHPGPLR